MEIKENEYIRTSKGYIFHNLSKHQLMGLKFLDVQYGRIAKHSFNIIDLIEVGDYVNGYKVQEKHTSCKYPLARLIKTQYEEITLDKQIKAIVTKEQFKSVEYKIEEGK